VRTKVSTPRCLLNAKRRYYEVRIWKQRPSGRLKSLNLMMDPGQRERYSRQILFHGIGEAGQEKLLAASAVLVGCGALGTVVANLLVRSGVGHLRIIDRDFVEPSNLQRQTLFEESDALESLPKAVAAERRLRAINSGVQVEGIVSDLTPQNAADLLTGFPLLIDGTDNFETRLLLNDAALSLGVPWIYAAAVGSYGVTMTILPGETACLACLLEGEHKSADVGGSMGAADTRDTAGRLNANGVSGSMGVEDTCDTAGVLNAAVGVVASIEAVEALKLLANKPEALHGRLVSCDVWTGKFQSIRVERNPDCRACARHEFTYLEGAAQPHITMCGRDSVQIHERNRKLDLSALGRRLAGTSATASASASPSASASMSGPASASGPASRSDSASEIRHNDFLLRFQVPPYEMTVFADGRAIIKGTKDPAVARSLYARFIGV
jgi:molybdopterin-synthase adenylyltransferase